MAPELGATVEKSLVLLRDTRDTHDLGEQLYGSVENHTTHR